VEAPGIEADQSPAADPIEHQNSPIGVRAVSANAPDRASKCAIDRREVTESSEAYELSNVVETALAKALVLAAEAKRWDVVLEISGELQRRRTAQRPPSAVPAKPSRARRRWRRPVRLPAIDRRRLAWPAASRKRQTHS